MKLTRKLAELSCLQGKWDAGRSTQDAGRTLWLQYPSRPMGRGGKNLVNLAVCATAHNQEKFVFITTSTHDLSCLVMSNWLEMRLWWNTSFWLARSVEFTGVWKSTNSRSGVASSFGKEPHQAQRFCKKLVNPSYGKCLFDWKLYIFEEQIIYSVCPGCYSIEVQVDQTWKGCHLGHLWKNTGKYFGKLDQGKSEGPEDKIEQKELHKQAASIFTLGSSWLWVLCPM